MKRTALIFSLILILTMHYTVIAQDKSSEVTRSADKVLISGKQYYLHVVKPGQTLYAIAKAYNVREEDIIAENPDAADGLKEGKSLKVPVLKGRNSNEKEISEADLFYYHIVEKGQNLDYLCKTYKTTIQKIKEANQGLDDKLRSGMIVRVPKPDEVIAAEKQKKEAEEAKKAAENEPIKYKVEKGQTLYSIAKKYNVSMDDIKKLNPGIEHGLKIGQELKIPVVKKTGTEAKQVADKKTKPVEQEHIKSADNGDKTESGKFKNETGYSSYEVKKKDSYESIAKANNTEVTEIKKANPQLAGKELKKGDIINIPIAKMAVRKDAQMEEAVDKTPASVVPCGKFDYKKTPVTFKIALMLPLYLKEFDSIKNLDTSQIKTGSNSEAEEIFQKSRVFVEFYEGLLLAADSLKKEGLSLDIHVYDSERDTNIVKKLIKNPELKEMDLIIGPVYSSCFDIVSQFAAQHKINIVSPLSSRNQSIHSNPWIFQVIPSVKEQVVQLIHSLSAYHDQKVVVIHSEMKEEKELGQMFKKEYTAAMGTGFNPELYKEIPITIDKTIQMGNESNQKVMATIKKQLSSTTGNLIVIPSSDAAYVTEIINQLNNINGENGDLFNLTVCGFPNWQKIDNIEIESLHNLQLITLSSNYIDYSLAEVKQSVLKYRNQFSAEPSQYSFQGFDVGMFFFSALKKYGRNFGDCLQESGKPFHGLQTDFSFKRIGKSGGFENQSIPVIQYTHDLNIIRLNRE
ncbi:MAG: LysM peptidoglycan-binding domain-containing protein [Bacteroidia bacterium]|nr:LysM peptidoglycan-binding domain-containing protein [Bacteroidia bacterium]